MKSKFCVALAYVAAWSGQSFALAEEGAAAPMEEVLVLSHPLSEEGLSQASVVLEGEALQRKVSGNIGATLALEPGIQSAQFGAAVGRPVIHGLGGPRIRIMQDRLDTLDLSVTSADHAVTIEPFIAERIEILKGSSTLLYGSGAIGGVVDVHTGRIPHLVPDAIVTGGIESRYDENADGHSTAAKLNGGYGKFAWHLDGTWKEGDDYQIPGFTESDQLRQEELSEGETPATTRGRLPGSEFDTETYAGGLSYVDDWGFVGAAITQIEADYGLPGGGHGHEEEEGEEEEGPPGATPSLDLEQTRGDFEVNIVDPFTFFSRFNARLGISNYEHQEIEPNGEVGTYFSNDAWELRSELGYERDLWSGLVGVQHTDREFSALGEEAFVPPVDTTDSGVFWVGQRVFEKFDLETGLRIGYVDHEPDVGSDTDFTTYSASLGFVIPLADMWGLGLVADYSSRAPVAEELYSDGPHLVTNAFERGDPNLDNETAFNLSATLRYDGDIWKATATAYYTDFGDFIYQQATGEEEDGLRVFQFQQDDASFYGLDAKFQVRIAQWQRGRAELRGQLDFVEAELDISGNDNIPRIPPLRFGVGAEARHGITTVSIDYIRVTEQDDAADQELETDGYDDLRAYLGFEVPYRSGSWALFVSGKNLTDDEQRNHTSFIKDVAPAPGRTIEAGVRWLF